MQEDSGIQVRTIDFLTEVRKFGGVIGAVAGASVISASGKTAGACERCGSDDFAMQCCSKRVVRRCAFCKEVKASGRLPRESGQTVAKLADGEVVEKRSRTGSGLSTASCSTSLAAGPSNFSDESARLSRGLGEKPASAARNHPQQQHRRRDTSSTKAPSSTALSSSASLRQKRSSKLRRLAGLDDSHQASKPSESSSLLAFVNSLR